MWDLIVSVPDHCLSFYFPFYPAKKGQSSGSPIIDPVNKSFETPAVISFSDDAVSVFCQN